MLAEKNISNSVEKPIEYLKGVGPIRGDLLKKELNIFSVGDLIFHFPFRYVDRTQISKICDINSETNYIQLKGIITNVHEVGQGRQKRLTAILKDDTGYLELVWFKGVKWIKDQVILNTEYIIYGKTSIFNNKLNIVHPDFENASLSQLEKIVGLQPIYPSTEKLKARGLDSRGIQKLVSTALSLLNEQDLPENLPKNLIQQYKFISRFQALTEIHQPANDGVVKKARLRLKFEELFIVQFRLIHLRSNRYQKSQGFKLSYINNFFDKFYNEQLKFELTNAQKKVLKEIRKDVLSGHQMNRLLQGDVGSGKTIVALMYLLMGIDNGFQVCFMAPTEILAQQHFQTTNEVLSPLGLNVSLLTGSVKGKARKAILEKLEEGSINVLIGTHALIEDHVKFKNLGCVVIDEQHRFGVAQRAKLWVKNNRPPHILVMTATPIPRTLAMTIYGDLDISVIDELPPGRKPILTRHFYDSKRHEVFKLLRDEIKNGRQVYIVYPLIKESETMDYKDLQDGYESIIRDFPPPQYQIGILHGQMKSEDKNIEMNRFSNGISNILVATSVIEVGVDVPNASVMVVESSERFGLSQLHQLRGRVGRGAAKSYCILMTGHKMTKEGLIRIRTLTSSNNGFDIAEADLKLRGPGDIEGTQQSGILNFKIADLSKDGRILQEARIAATNLVEEDPDLGNPGNIKLKYFLEKTSKKKTWAKIS